MNKIKFEFEFFGWPKNGIRIRINNFSYPLTMEARFLVCQHVTEGTVFCYNIKPVLS